MIVHNEDPDRTVTLPAGTQFTGKQNHKTFVSKDPVSVKPAKKIFVVGGYREGPPAGRGTGSCATTPTARSAWPADASASSTSNDSMTPLADVTNP
ncbi:hypothetical protein SsS58_05450 [Streptomyces scabiei]|uniref:GlxA-like beta barrel domain-containing protein n=1 Tax=Streptomyces scabiei TaxID=1930 RepID=A0A117EF56_STRSC|nr:hypothetical protein SsS58_05450 [Streptomyces scabiei]